MALLDGGGKLPGKTAYSDRRRPMTRQSGFKTHEDTTGGEYERVRVAAFKLKKGETLSICFQLPHHEATDFLGFGGWFQTDKPVKAQIIGSPAKYTLTTFSSPNWNKFGSLWSADRKGVERVEVIFTADYNCRIALHRLQCGIVLHSHLKRARIELLPNMYQFAPEALFVTKTGTVRVTHAGKTALTIDSYLDLIEKSCNRCGRYLPINIIDERTHLSFSNHCVAANRCPCRHATFSKLRNRENPLDRIVLKHGYQLECRFCKKFEVNAAHNPQRTTSQMKEDAARRRAFELLIEGLVGGSSQLKYRHQTGRELAEDIYKNFGGKCFNCGEPLSARGLQLDHTRPLALLWPLDVTATALCRPCNSKKRDRPPTEFYNDRQLAKLAVKTGIPLAELKDPKPNTAIIKKLSSRLNWFFEDFLCSDEMNREHDGKTPRKLLLKALYKALSHSSDDIAKELTQRIKEREENAS
jgi:hypothetical protein